MFSVYSQVWTCPHLPYLRFLAPTAMSFFLAGSTFRIWVSLIQFLPDQVIGRRTFFMGKSRDILDIWDSWLKRLFLIRLKLTSKIKSSVLIHTFLKYVPTLSKFCGLTLREFVSHSMQTQYTVEGGGGGGMTHYRPHRCRRNPFWKSFPWQ